MEPQHIKSVLESLLFVAGKPLTLKDFSKFLALPEETISPLLLTLIEERKTSGVVVLESSEGFQMSTNPSNSTQVKNFLNADLREKLTDATVEVLGIIAYRQPISKAEIEAIRGVNSQYSLRTLLIRGLIEKTPNPQDSRSSLYQTTTEFLQHMGINSVNDLPEFEQLVAQIKLPETTALKNEAESALPAQTETGEGSAPAVTQSLSETSSLETQNSENTADEFEDEDDEEENDEET
jgi:segregation and condensation protein B